MNSRVIFVHRYKPWREEFFRPACEASREIALWLRQRSFTREDINMLKSFGIDVRTKEVLK